MKKGKLTPEQKDAIKLATSKKRLNLRARKLILTSGHRLTNDVMATRLGIPTQNFAGILAAMKRGGELSHMILKTDALKAEKTNLRVLKTATSVTPTSATNIVKTTTTKVVRTRRPNVVQFEKVATIKASDFSADVCTKLINNLNVDLIRIIR